MQKLKGIMMFKFIQQSTYFLSQTELFSMANLLKQYNLISVRQAWFGCGILKDFF